MRIAAGVEYNGSRYHGWQYQSNSLAVQQLVEAALSKVANQPITVMCAGRTDTGVHATAQVIHFDSHAQRAEHSWVFGANTNMPFDISLLWARPVSDDFHARFSATARRYRYVINNRWTRTALFNSLVSSYHKALDADAMHTAAQSLLGEQDFSAFRAAECQSNTPMREVFALDVLRVGDYIYIDIEANAFLHHMVRNIVGVLLAIGMGDRPVSWAAEVLALRDRRQAGVTAPPNGLYLVDVQYPAHYGLPQRLSLPIFA